MSTLNFYQRPVALNRERHRHLKLDATAGNYLFAAKTNSLLLATVELLDAAASYPVVFIGDLGGPFTLCAMVGLNNEENLFVDADGVWDAGSYIPAFARRYPFVLAGGTDDNADLTVYIDEAYAGFGETTGEPLFADDAKDTPLLVSAIDFLQNYHAEMKATAAFGARLNALGLLTAKNFEVVRNGQRRMIEGVVTVDPDKLATLDDATVLQMVRSGDMALVHAHLLSLKQIPHLAVRVEQRQAVAG